MTVAEQVVRGFARASMTIAVAESLTGGALASALVDVPGASAVVRGAVVAYATELKHSLLGVPAGLLAERGAVDPDVAAAMAVGIRASTAIAGTQPTVGIATTGVAGPDPQDGQPVGRVYIAVATETSTYVHTFAFAGNRTAIREASVAAALQMLVDVLGNIGQQ